MRVDETIREIIREIPTDATVDERMHFLLSRQKKEQGLVAQHAFQVARTARDLATGMSLEENLIDDIYLAACWHDIGKLAIPNHILNKPQKLTPDEYQIARMHTDAGMALIGETTKKVLKEVVLYHHERYDGHGYNGLKGNQIPISARITAIADVHTALKEKRSYKDGLSEEHALILMTQDVDSPQFGRRSFDPDVLRFFVAMRLNDEAVEISATGRRRLAMYASSNPVPERVAA